jgi:hypothetical protein
VPFQSYIRQKRPKANAGPSIRPGELGLAQDDSDWLGVRAAMVLSPAQKLPRKNPPAERVFRRPEESVGTKTTDLRFLFSYHSPDDLSSGGIKAVNPISCGARNFLTY